MIARLMMIALVSLALTGCATTQPKVSPVNQLQTQVVDLEQRMEEQEKEIVSLKYEVKEMSGKPEAKSADEGDSDVAVSAAKPAKSAKGSSARAVEGESAGTGIIRVAVSVSEVQKALKNAGLYEGAVDGKIGSKTRAAVVEFQKQHGLKSDGVIGQKTWAAMKTYLAE